MAVPRLATRAERLPAAHVGTRPLPLAVVGSLALALLSLLAPSAPTYDPWAWILWGREIAALELDTTFGPSWKPLPVLFTTVFSFFGDAAPTLWLVVARAGGILAVFMAFRTARRLAGGTPGLLAGAVAAAGIVLGAGWVRHVSLGNSEGLLAALALLAVDRHLDERRGQAFAFGFGAALLRPEVWPFLGAYALFLCLKEPSRRPLVAALLVLLPVLWFVPDLVATGDPLRSSSRAQSPNPGSPAFAERPALEVLRRFRDIAITPVHAGFLVGLAWAGAAFARRRRDGVTLALGVAALALVAIVALMTEAGYSGNLRYLLLPAALEAVVAGVGFARVLQAAPARRRAAPARAALAAALLAASLPFAVPRGVEVARQLPVLEFEGRLYGDLAVAVADAKRTGVAACGTPVTGPFHVPGLAWHLGVHIRDVALEPRPPGVVFRAPTTPRAEPAPSLPPPETGFRRVASVGAWEVFSTCPAR